MGADIMWRAIEGYDGLYEVNQNGEVASLRFNHSNKRKLVKPFANSNGYLLVKLYKDGKKKNLRVHRIVANAFLKKLDGKDQVNHKNGDRTDNRLENLEWTNNSGNQAHSVYVLKTNYFANTRRPKKIIDLYTNREYESISRASKETGVGKSVVSASIKTGGRFHEATK